MFGDRFSSSTSCSRWVHETEPDRPDQSLTCCFLKVATHPEYVIYGCKPRRTALRSTRSWSSQLLSGVILPTPIADSRIPWDTFGLAHGTENGIGHHLGS